jgi:hypothetical protein
MSGTPDSGIQYIDGGSDTSVPARPGLTGFPGADNTGSLPASLGGDDPAVKSTMRGLSAAVDRKLGEDNYLRDTYDTRLRADQAKMDRAFQAESASAADAANLKPWNADQQRADRIKGPLENFGSVGTIFALAASAFTKTPMISALNASAAAMNAMREGDELSYKSAYQAWKDNIELAHKRFEMERAVYDDASKLAAHDLSAWTSRMSVAATQFNDEKLKVMIDNGMVAEVFQTMDARSKAMEQSVKEKTAFQDMNLTNDIAKDKLQQWHDANPKPPADAPQADQIRYGFQERAAEHQALINAKRQVAQSKSTTHWMTPDQQLYEQIRQKYEGDPDAATKVADEYADAIRRREYPPGGGAGGARSGTPSDDNTKMDAAVKAEHPDWNSSQVIEERNRRIRQSKESTRPSVQVENAKTLADTKTDVQKEHPDWTPSQVDREANKQVAQSKTVISGNRADDLRGQIGRIDRADEVIDRVEGLMKTHKMITGLGGTISRRGEIIGNVLGGSNSTAYNEFKSDLAILKDWWERLENNALTQGRPLSAAEKRVGDIIPGLSIGDTVQHTADQLNRVKKIFTEMRAENESRLKGESPGAPAPAAKPSWRDRAIPVP